MFNKGDTVVCIDDSDVGSSGLLLHKKYVVDFIFDSMYCYLYPINQNGEVGKMSGVFPKKRFITLEEFRKQKINKIRERCLGKVT